MTSAWRIDKASRSARDSFSGIGASITGGRWNHPGTHIVYAADSLALAAMEKFVHLGDEGRSLALASFRIDIPAGVRVEELKRKDLPADWKAIPAPKSTREIGTDWIQNGLAPALRVPSVVIDTQCNFLINPFHPDFSRLKIHPPQPFRLDPRMWKG